MRRSPTLHGRGQRCGCHRIPQTDQGAGLCWAVGRHVDVGCRFRWLVFTTAGASASTLSPHWCCASGPILRSLLRLSTPPHHRAGTGASDHVVRCSGAEAARLVLQKRYRSLRVNGLAECADEVITRALRARLDGYLTRVVDRDFVEQGHPIRKPDALRRWLTAYAAATANTTSLDKIRSAATSGEGETTETTTVQAYRDVLERLWLTDPVPG